MMMTYARVTPRPHTHALTLYATHAESIAMNRWCRQNCGRRWHRQWGGQDPAEPFVYQGDGADWRFRWEYRFSREAEAFAFRLQFS